MLAVGSLVASPFFEVVCGFYSLIVAKVVVLYLNKRRAVFANFVVVAYENFGVAMSLGEKMVCLGISGIRLPVRCDIYSPVEVF